MKKSLALLFFICTLSGATFAQSFNLVEGNLNDIKKEKKLNVEFLYDKMGVGKFATEQEYVTQKITDYNAKEPGRGDTWVASWRADRANRYEPNFISLYAKYSKTQMIGNFPDAKYTMIFSTTYTEPGFNIYVTRKNAHINAEITIVETADRSKVVAKIIMLKAPGRTMGGNDYDTGARIEEAYAAAGKRLSMFIMK
ncbi:MAG: hypothetical protein EYC69_01435 [Bacteroidetes bacterium]|nr:MAG: hypothetical protein EYC69_01435 [Bacteroidota bacterium]